MKTANLFLLLILFLYSCKKDKFHKESVSGIALHYVTKLPLANQSVILAVNTTKIGPKDDEFPNGRPIFSSTKYYSVTDNAGHFSFDFKVDAADWGFTVTLKTGQYTQKFPAPSGGVVWVPASGTQLYLNRMKYDTVWGEQPGYVKYHIKNINDTYANDTLKLATYYYRRPSIWDGGPIILFPDEYNWIFTGTTIDKLITDTIPAESEPQIPVKWLHRRSGTIADKNELINVSPGTTSDYYINY